MNTTETLKQLETAINSGMPFAKDIFDMHVLERENERFSDFFWGFMTSLFLCALAFGAFYASR